MATSKDQPKTIIEDFARVIIRVLDGWRQTGRGVRMEFFRDPRSTPDAVDGLVPSRLDDPGSRGFRNAGHAPLVNGSRKGFLRRLFGHVEIADESNQRGDNPPPIEAGDW